MPNIAIKLSNAVGNFPIDRMVASLCLSKSVAIASTFIGPFLVTSAAVVILILINSYDIHGIDKVFVGMIVAVACTCGLILVYSIFALLCGKERAMFDLTVTLFFFSLIMVAFSVIFWAKRIEFRAMVEEIWLNPKNSEMRTGFQKQFECSEDKCKNRFIRFVDNIGNIIATCLCVLTGILLIVNATSIYLQYSVRVKLESDSENQNLANLIS